jgi:ATP-binding cassette, subfamily C, type I secretion system permease/ATPase
MSNPPLLLVHFAGLLLAVGSLIILDLRLATLLFGRRVRRFDIVLVQRFAPVVKLGLILLWASGVGLLFASAVNAPQLLIDPKLHAKLIIVVILTINGILVEKLCLPALSRNEGRGLFGCFTRVARFQLITIAAISAVSWYFATFLALADRMQFSFAVDAARILQYYGCALALAIFIGALMVQRIPRSVAASRLESSPALTTSDAKPHQAKKSRSSLRNRVRTAFLGVAACSLVINLLMLTTAIFLMQVLDRVLIGRSHDTLVYLSVIAFMAVALLCAFDIMRRRMLIRLGGWVQRSLSPVAYLKELENTRSKVPCSSELLRELGMIRAFLCSTSIVTLFDVLWMPVPLVVLYALSPLLALIASIGAVLLLGFVYVMGRLIGRVSKDAEAASMDGLRNAETAFRNIDVVHSMSMGAGLVKSWRETNDEAGQLNDHAGNRSALVVSFARFLELAIQISVIGAGAWLVLNQRLSIGAMIVAALIVARALTAIAQSAGTWQRARAARQAWRRICDIVGQRPSDGQTMLLPRPFGHLTIEGLTYAPPGVEEPVILALNLDARPGEVLAITGPAGAGKSTLARLMLGLAPWQEGAIRLDGIDISMIDPRQIGQHIGYLPQEVELLPGTVYRNIARMSEGSSSDVIEAAHLAGAHEMILRFAMGYDTVIGLEDCRLSSGERRRIALARAFYGRPALLVLDEPGGSFDMNGEKAFAQALSAFRDIGTTIVILVNQPGLLTHADRIAVLNGGQLSMIGSRDQVLAHMARPGSRRRGPPYMRIIQ